MIEPPPAAWAAHIEALLASTRWGPVIALDEVDSTQDEVQRRELAVGGVVITGRQTAGRGRYGRRWHDTGEGLAITVVAPSTAPARAATLCAVALADGLQRFAAHPLRVKPPNDVMVRGGKLAGVLVEQDDVRARIGIGVNVHQRTWPESLAGLAVSLTQVAGAATQLTRPDIAAAVLTALDAWWDADDGELAAAFAQRAWDDPRGG